MLLLASTSDLLRIVTTAAVSTHVHASYVDKAGATITPGRQNTVISTAATTTIVPSPAASTYRTVKTVHIHNVHATTAQTVTVVHTDGATAVDLIQVTLQAGYVLHYDEGAGWEILDERGGTLQNSSDNGSGAAVNALNLAVLAADVTNANAVANTIADITGLSFSVTAGESYYFRFVIFYTAAAITTGARFAVNGPGSPTRLGYRSNYGLTTASESVNNGLTAYDQPAAANATSPVTGYNTAVVEGIVQPSANGTLIARFASEVASSAIIARAGSFVEWVRLS